MEIFGLAAWYRINKTLTPIPVRIPISRGRTRQAMKVPIPGIRSLSAINKKIINIIKVHV